MNIHGGTLRFSGYSRGQSATINFLSGTIQLAGNRNIGTDVAITDFFGAVPVIPTAKGITVEGTATLLTTLTLNDGTFSVGDIANGNLLNFQSGTFRMTQADLLIGNTGQFGPVLELTAGQHYVIDNAANLGTDALLMITSGTSFTSTQLNNAGEVALNGLTTRLASGSLYNSGLLRGDGRMDSTVTNLAAGEVRVGPGQRLVFTSAPLANQGQVNIVGGTLDLRHGTNNSGVINLTGGAADVYGDVNVLSGGRISVGGSTTATLFGNITQNGIVSVAPGSKAVFFGNVSGSGSFALSGTAEFLGAISPGNSPGSMTFGGNVSLYDTASLNIELAGNSTAEYDRLLVSGQLSLAGTLAVSLIDGFVPAANASFDILNWGTLVGTFDALLLPALTGNLQWDISQLYTSGVLSVTSPGVDGDYNNDGVVNAADYVVWRDNLGNSVVLPNDPSPAMVPHQDFGTWRANFGETTGGELTSSGAIPKPTSVILLLMGMLAFAFHRAAVS